MQLVTHLGVALVDGMCDGLHKMVPHTPVRIGVPKVSTLSLTGNSTQNTQQRTCDKQKHNSWLAKCAYVPHAGTLAPMQR